VNQVQCPDSTLHFESTERLLLRGEAHLTEEENFEDYVSNNDIITLDKSAEGHKEMGDIHKATKQNNNIATSSLHNYRKGNVVRYKRETKRTNNKNSAHSHNRKRARTDEYLYKSLSNSTEHIRSIPGSGFVDKHVQQEDTSGDISEYNNNIKYRLHNTNLPGTNRRGPISGNGTELICTDDDRITGYDIRTSDIVNATPPSHP
jgi:hypothetical protein